MSNEKEGFGQGSGPRFIVLECEDINELETRLNKESLDDYVAVGFTSISGGEDFPWAVLPERRDLHFRSGQSSWGVGK